MNGIETHWGGVTIAIGNQKGGVGKTTTAVHLARGFALRGHRTLLIDLDPSAGATLHLGVCPDEYHGVFELLTGEAGLEDCLLDHTETDRLPENLTLLPSSRRLESVDKRLGEANRFGNPADVLVSPTARLRGMFDIIVLDTPPSTTLSTSLSAYKVADYFILATLAEPLAMGGLCVAAQDIETVRRHGNANLRLLGICVGAAHSRALITRWILHEIDQAFPGPGSPELPTTLRLVPTIRRSTVVARVQRMGLTLFDRLPDHPVTLDFRAMVEAVEHRIAAAQRGLHEEDAYPPALANTQSIGGDHDPAA